MFRGDLIIDGYNLLHAAGLAAPADAPRAFDRSRQALLGVIVHGLTLAERQRTTVVFDAPLRVMGPSPPQTVDEVQVLFADGDGDADVAIERLIQQNSAPRRLWVVSSDHRLQIAARRRRAKPLDSEEFLKRLARRSARSAERKEQEPAIKHAGRLPPGEVEAWLRLFDMEPVDRMAEDERSRPAAGRSAQASTASGTPDPPSATADSAQPNPAELDELLRSFEGEIDFWKARISELDDENHGRGIDASH